MMKLGLSQMHYNFVKSEFIGTRWYILEVGRPLLKLRTAQCPLPEDRVIPNCSGYFSGGRTKSLKLKLKSK